MEFINVHMRGTSSYYHLENVAKKGSPLFELFPLNDEDLGYFACEFWRNV